MSSQNKTGLNGKLICEMPDRDTKPTKIQVINYLAKRLKACGVPENGKTPYTVECLTDRARIALEDKQRELFFEHVGDIWVPDIRMK